jgi:intracellular septation protein A
LDQKTLIKNMLLSFLPLLLFVAAEEYLSNHFPEQEATRYALILAISLGIIQTAYVWVKEKRLDKMLLMDTGLIVLLGGVSLFSGNDLFFKIKPALVQFIMVLVLGFMAFMKPSLLSAMTGRIMKGVELQDSQLKAMQRSTQWMVAVLFLHCLLIIYSAFYLSAEAWAFISGPLIYIVAAVYFAGMLLFRRWKNRQAVRKESDSTP